MLRGMKSKKMIKRNINIKDTDSANIFLRALWASIRTEFGHLAWNYQALTIKLDKGLKKIIFGDIDIIDKPTTVSILFISKGTIDDICFDAEFSENESKKINRAIDEALNYKQNLNQYSVEFYIETDYPIAQYKTDYFSIEECKNKSNKISINIFCFDKVDCNTIAKEKIEIVRDVLSAHCWRVIFLTDKGIVNQDEKFNLKYFDEKEDSMWDVEHAIFNGKITLSIAVIKIIDNILLFQKPSNQIVRFQNAARLYHNGLKIEYEFIRKRSDIDWFEWIQVNFISSLEILSIPDNVDNKRCETCGQLEFSISKRVKEFVNKYFPERDDILKLINYEYSKRSSLVHEGIHFSKRSYAGVSVPQIEKSNNYTQNQIFINPNLKYLFGHFFKHYIENEIIIK